MKMTYAPLLLATLITVAACSPTHTLPPGEYKKTERSVNSAGTESEKTTKTKVYYDQYGNKKADEETTKSNDPKGLFNKSTSTTTKSYN